jgi:hypothetical protein
MLFQQALARKNQVNEQFLGNQIFELRIVTQMLISRPWSHFRFLERVNSLTDG